MPKKTTILIIILALVTMSLIFLAVREETKKPSSNTEKPISQNTQPSPTKEAEKTAVLSFSPAFLDLSESAVTTSSVDIFVNNGEKQISGIQIELQYDPAVLKNVTIGSGTDTIFGANPNVLISQVDETTGRITHIVGINLNDEEVEGVGKIATLTFNAVSGSTPQTIVEFIDQSIVTTLDTTESILKETLPLTISLPQSGGFIPQQSPSPIQTTQ